uniref:Uncharacterized protein n=1 Tax=Romanomermis culicivorax TaxID=13658 RepID=A0A915IL79_ROMCU
MKNRHFIHLTQITKPNFGLKDCMLAPEMLGQIFQMGEFRREKGNQYIIDMIKISQVTVNSDDRSNIKE